MYNWVYVCAGQHQPGEEKIFFLPVFYLLLARMFFPARWKWPKPDSQPANQTGISRPTLSYPAPGSWATSHRLPSSPHNQPTTSCYSNPDQTWGHYRELSRQKSNIHGCNTFQNITLSRASLFEPVSERGRRVMHSYDSSGGFKKAQCLLTLGKTLVWGWTSPLVWELGEEGQRSDQG